MQRHYFYDADDARCLCAAERITDMFCQMPRCAAKMRACALSMLMLPRL